MNAQNASVLRRSADTALPFLVGILIGVLGSFSVLSGRLATIEAKQVNDEASIGVLQAGITEILRTLRTR